MPARLVQLVHQVATDQMVGMEALGLLDDPVDVDDQEIVVKMVSKVLPALMAREDHGVSKVSMAEAFLETMVLRAPPVMSVNEVFKASAAHRVLRAHQVLASQVTMAHEAILVSAVELAVRVLTASLESEVRLVSVESQDDEVPVVPLVLLALLALLEKMAMLVPLVLRAPLERTAPEALLPAMAYLAFLACQAHVELQVLILRALQVPKVPPDMMVVRAMWVPMVTMALMASTRAMVLMVPMEVLVQQVLEAQLAQPAVEVHQDGVV